MKIAFTLLSSLIFISTAFAYDESRLTISVAGKSEFEVVVDYHSYTTENNSLLLADIKPGYHTIKIYRIRGGRGSSVRINDRNELINSTRVNVKSGYHVDVMINRFGKALVDEQAVITLEKNDGLSYRHSNPNALNETDRVLKNSVFYDPFSRQKKCDI